MANRGRGAFDLVLDSGDLLMGFNLASSKAGRSTQAPSIKTSFEPARAGDAPTVGDVPRMINDLDAGMGFSRRIESVENGYAFALPGYTRSPGGMFCPPGKLTEIALPAAGAWSPDQILESYIFNGDLYLISQGRHVLSVAGPAGDGPAVVAADGGATFRGFGATVFNNKLYVAGAYGGLIAKDGATGAWSAPAVGVTRAWPRTVNWRPLGVPTDVMVAAMPVTTGPWPVRWCPITADPMVDANWSAPVRVGQEGTGPINDIVVAPHHAYFLRGDGVYDIDELGTRAFNITPWLEENRDFNNGTWGMHTGQGLYYGHSHGLCYIPTDGAAQYDPVWCHPGWGLPYEGPVRGVTMAGTLHNGWRLIGLYDNYARPYTSYVCAGLPDERAYGAANHTWHGAEAVVPGQITHMKVHTTVPGGGWPRLLITTLDDTVTPVVVRAYWMSLPKFGSPIQEMLYGGGFEPADAASLFLPVGAWERPSAIKTLMQIDLVTERLSDTDTLRVWAQADGGAWADQGGADTGTFASLHQPAPVSGRALTARVDAVGHPILRSVEFRAALGIELREARVYSIVLGEDDGLRTPRGSQWRDPEARLLDLQTMLGRIVTVDDGRQMRARVLQVLPGARRPIGAPSRSGAWTMTCDVTVSVLERPFRWDRGDPFDTNRPWG